MWKIVMCYNSKINAMAKIYQNRYIYVPYFHIYGNKYS